jgi:hypothetical protein
MQGALARLAILALALVPAGMAVAEPVGIDPLEARIEVTDARRFARVFVESGGKPSAAALQAGYLSGAGRGVEIFTPGRIQGPDNLARAVAREPARYAHAIETCLPIVDELAGEMRAIYLGFQGLSPRRPLPAVHVVFGAGNSGGTAAADAQVLGLEVLCGPDTTAAQFRGTMREMFAHETVHSWQGTPTEKALADPLLYYALLEGVPDLMASLVTGSVPTPARDRWARPQEAELWAQFQIDRETVRAGTRADGSMTAEARAARDRWFANYQKAPPGWPHEAGYWVGMRIAGAYLARATDKRAALDVLLEADDPAAILAASGYAGKDWQLP